MGRRNACTHPGDPGVHQLLDLWPDARGPAAAPFDATGHGFGSVKAAKIINHGACGVFQAYQKPDGTGLLQLLGNSLPPFVLHAVAETTNNNDTTCDNVEKRWLTLAPFLDFTTDKEDAQLGGFFLGTNIQVNDAVLQGGPNMVVRDASRWRLFNGRLTVQGEVLGIEGSGTMTDTFKIAFNQALTREMDAPLAPGETPTTVAEAVYSIADSSQAFDSHFACGQRSPGDSTVLANDTDPDALCFSFVHGLEAAFDTAKTGVGATTLGLTSAELEQARETMLAEQVVDNGDTVWSNIRCSQLAGANGPTCNYALPAKRLNVYPDGVELVFLDDLKELDNPVYPIWMIDLEGEYDGRASSLAPLCDDPIGQTPGSLTSRSFSALPAFDYVQYKCIGDGCACDLIGSFNNGKSSCTDTGAPCTSNLDCCSGACDIGNTENCK